MADRERIRREATHFTGRATNLCCCSRLVISNFLIASRIAVSASGASTCPRTTAGVALMREIIHVRVRGFFAMPLLCAKEL